MIVILAALFAAAPPQESPPDLADMVGARAGQAEAELERRGYRNVGGEKSDDRAYAYWWNAGRSQCVTIATMEGRYASITASPAPDCQQRASRSTRERPERSTGIAAPYELSQRCRAEAANRWDRRPSEITVNAPIRQRNGSLVQGWYERDGGRTTFFTCRFDENDRFVSVL